MRVLNRQVGIWVVALPAIMLSLVSIAVGARGQIYMISAALSLVASVFYFIRVARGRELVVATVSFAVIFILGFLNVLQADITSQYSISAEMIRLAGVLCIFLAMYAAFRMSNLEFETLMLVVALVHIPSLYFMVLLGAQANADTGRIYTENLATATVAEVALGTAMASVLSKRPLLIVGGGLFCAFIVAYTQMRAVGVSLALAVLVFLLLFPWFYLRGYRRVFVFFLSMVSFFVVLNLYLDEIISFLTRALLIFDPYRGFASGFSGRFDNWAVGLEIFTDNLITGVGLQDPIMNYTHNGYILTLGQYGLFVGGLFIFGFLWSIRLAFAARRLDVLIVLLVLAAYFAMQPRNVNFQLFPLVGLLAVARAFSAGRRRVAQDINPRTLQKIG